MKTGRDWIGVSHFVRDRFSPQRSSRKMDSEELFVINHNNTDKRVKRKTSVDLDLFKEDGDYPVFVTLLTYLKKCDPW
jgi:hypothetical protein